MTPADRALKRVTELLGNLRAETCRRALTRIEGVDGASCLLRRVASAPDEEQMLDCLAEVLYALVFRHLAFQVAIQPCGDKGPDLRVARDGSQALVEVTRLRRIHEGPPRLDMSADTPRLSRYGDPHRDTRKALQKIMAKFAQIGEEPAIIALWNDDGDNEEVEVTMAVRDLQSDADQRILSVPNGLLFLLYGSTWVGRTATGLQFHCFPLRPLKQPYSSWRLELSECLLTSVFGSLDAGRDFPIGQGT